MTKLVGYKKITSKKSGKDFCVASVVQDVSEREKENGTINVKNINVIDNKGTINM